jgi:hypothetical protein
MEKDEVLFELLNLVDQNAGEDYHNICTRQEFEERVERVKEALGFDYNNHYASLKEKWAADAENQPVDRDPIKKVSTPNY